MSTTPALRYHAYHALPGRRGFAEVLVEMEPGRFRDRRETPTGRTFRTQRAADAAMAERNRRPE